MDGSLVPFPFPLCELHRHLEGSARPSTLWQAAVEADAMTAADGGEVDGGPVAASKTSAAADGVRRWLREQSSKDSTTGSASAKKSVDSEGLNDNTTGTVVIGGFLQRFPTVSAFEAAAVLTRPLLASGDAASGLTQCMAMFELVRACLATGPETVERVTFECIEDAHADGIRVLDLRYSPMYIQQGNPPVFPTLMDVHTAVLRGLARAKAQFSMAVGLIGIIDRHWPLEVAQVEAEFIFEHKGDFVGVDLANDESMFPAGPFAPLFRRATELGLAVTVHAAEVSVASGFENARVAIEQLGASRIGHGIGILSDPSGETLELVKKAGVVVECCPTSNLLVTDVKFYKAHPLRRLKDAGVRVTVSTDDPQLFGVSLLWELRNLIKEGVLTEDEVREINEVACEASFVPNNEKKQFFKL